MSHNDDNPGGAERWLHSQVQYVRARLSYRADVVARLADGRVLRVHHVYAVPPDVVVLHGELEDGSEFHYSAAPEALALDMVPTADGEECTSFNLIGSGGDLVTFVVRARQPPPPTDRA